MNNILILLCILLWGISSFLNRLSVERMPPLLMQVIVGSVFLFYIPVALRLTGEGFHNPLHYKWSPYSIVLTVIATLCSIAANVLLYTSLKGDNQSGTSTMMISLYPVVTLILSIFILHQHFSTWKLVGVALMLLGTWFLTK